MRIKTVDVFLVLCNEPLYCDSNFNILLNSPHTHKIQGLDEHRALSHFDGHYGYCEQRRFRHILLRGCGFWHLRSPLFLVAGA